MPLTDVDFLTEPFEVNEPTIILPLAVMRGAEESGELVEMIQSAANALEMTGNRIVVIMADENYSE